MRSLVGEITFVRNTFFFRSQFTSTALWQYESRLRESTKHDQILNIKLIHEIVIKIFRNSINMFSFYLHVNVPLICTINLTDCVTLDFSSNITNDH